MKVSNRQLQARLGWSHAKFYKVKRKEPELIRLAKAGMVSEIENNSRSGAAISNGFEK